MSNPNNPNNGSVGTKDVGELLTKVGIAGSKQAAHTKKASPDISPDDSSLKGPSFLPGSPAGREAKPQLKRGSKPGYLR